MGAIFNRGGHTEVGKDTISLGERFRVCRRPCELRQHCCRRGRGRTGMA